MLGGSGLPVPELIAHGTDQAVGAEPGWAWLIEAKASGQPWSWVAEAMPGDRRQRAAAELGATLRRWHAAPHANPQAGQHGGQQAGGQGSGSHLGSGWGIFVDLIRDELEHLGKHDERLTCFPTALRPRLRALAESMLAEVDVSSPTSLLHGDLHGENVLIDPASGAVTGIIDLNEMYAGHPWYDLADVCFRLLYGEPECVRGFLTGYGIGLGHEPDGGPAMQVDAVALRLLGWGLLHDFDVLTSTCLRRGVPDADSMPTASDAALTALAGHVTGLPR